MSTTTTVPHDTHIINASQGWVDSEQYMHAPEMSRSGCDLRACIHWCLLIIDAFLCCVRKCCMFGYAASAVGYTYLQQFSIFSSQILLVANSSNRYGETKKSPSLIVFHLYSSKMRNYCPTYNPAGNIMPPRNLSSRACSSGHRLNPAARRPSLAPASADNEWIQKCRVTNKWIQKCTTMTCMLRTCTVV